MAYRKILTYEQIKQILYGKEMFIFNVVTELNIIRALELVSAEIPYNDLIIYYSDEKVDIISGYEFISILDYIINHLEHCLMIYNYKKEKKLKLFEVEKMIKMYFFQIIILESEEEKNYYNIYTLEKYV